jgi:type 1 glutamine amidotransferase
MTKTWIKRGLLTLLGLVLLVAVLVYVYLKSIGIIPTNVYETEPPVLPDFLRPAVLVLNKTNGFIHSEALPAADAALTAIAKDKGWDIYVTDNAATHNTADLQRFKLVVWNNVSGDVLTESQRADFRAWIEAGGGWLGIHNAGGSPSYQWDWYVDTLVRAQFVGHTMGPQFQDADLHSSSAATAFLPSPWNIDQEEWYAFAENPADKGSEVLVVIDEDSYVIEGQTFFGNDHMEGEHPLLWRHSIGEGRAVFSAIGHHAVTYQLPEYRQLLADAMGWAMQSQP